MRYHRCSICSLCSSHAPAQQPAKHTRATWTTALYCNVHVLDIYATYYSRCTDVYNGCLYLSVSTEPAVERRAFMCTELAMAT